MLALKMIFILKGEYTGVMSEIQRLDIVLYLIAVIFLLQLAELTDLYKYKNKNTDLTKSILIFSFFGCLSKVTISMSVFTLLCFTVQLSIRHSDNNVTLIIIENILLCHIRYCHQHNKCMIHWILCKDLYFTNK